MNNSPSNKKVHDFNIEQYRLKFIARLCMINAIFAVLIPRLVRVSAESTLNSTTELFYVLALPFPVMISLVIAFEYFLFRRLGSGFAKYSTLMDIIILILFIADWMMVLIANLNRVQRDNPVCFQLGAIFAFTAFSWRTLVVTLIVQKWQLKIIAPIIAVSVATGYAMHYKSGTIAFMLVTCVAQLFAIVVIIYCEDKIKWKIMWANIQKEKWMQVNNFILNSIPENITILDINPFPLQSSNFPDLEKKLLFSSEYCKSFLQKCDLPPDPKDFFKKVQDLKQQQISQPHTPSTAILQLTTATNGLLGENENTKSISHSLLLEDLISNFRTQILKKQIDERQFAIYHGKLKIEGHQERSLEVKISFVQHFENYYIILIIRDTTQRDLLIALEETNKYKDQLLASVSHELRAPLNGNINLVESAVNSSKIPDYIKESCLIPALKSSKFLLHMINDILDMSQIKEKKLRLVFNSENLEETLKSTLQLVELQAKKKGIDLLLEIGPSFPTQFRTDHIRLSQIVLNLVNNAIKFTKKGYVKVTATKIIPESNWIQIVVEDSGIGMSQENVQNLFSTYTHIEFEERQNLNPTGVGLGLNIAYNLALLLGPKENHQGISVTSVPGQGSTFSFIIENQEMKSGDLKTDSDDSCEIINESPQLRKNLPFSKLQKNPSTSASTARLIGKSELLTSLDPKCTCSKILVVDDNPFNTMAFETILNSIDVKCDSVYSGPACIKSLLNRQNKPCGPHCKQFTMVFMDQEMPEMTGSETVQEIKRLQEENLLPPSIKVIGCTAHKSKEEVEKFMEAGFKQCLHKPISISMIQDILKEIVLDI